jgi:oligosaccharide repeat unit polymerase
MGAQYPFGYGWYMSYPIRVLFGLKERMEGLTLGLTPGSEWTTGTFLSEFYMDFGITGVLIFSFILGVVCQLIYHNMRTKPTIFKIFLYSYLVWNIIFSVYANGFILFDFYWNIMFFLVFDILVKERSKRID